MNLFLNPSGQDDCACGCCGAAARTVWGDIVDRQTPFGLYHAHWTVGRVSPDHPGTLDLVLRASDDCDGPARRVVSLRYARVADGGTAAIVDADGCPAIRKGFAGVPLARDAVIDTPLADQAFEVAGSVLTRDLRAFRQDPPGFYWPGAGAPT